MQKDIDELNTERSQLKQKTKELQNNLDAKQKEVEWFQNGAKKANERGLECSRKVQKRWDVEQRDFDQQLKLKDQTIRALEQQLAAARKE